MNTHSLTHTHTHTHSLTHARTHAPLQKGGDAGYIGKSDTREAKAMAQEQDRWLNKTLVSQRIGVYFSSRQIDHVPLMTHS